jgi:hypothetical protein
MSPKTKAGPIWLAWFGASSEISDDDTQVSFARMFPREVIFDHAAGDQCTRQVAKVPRGGKHSERYRHVLVTYDVGFTL